MIRRLRATTAQIMSFPHTRGDDPIEKPLLQILLHFSPHPWEMYRRKLKVLNQNKLIVFADDYFGIFLSHEVFMLADVPIRDTEKELNITRDQVRAKYTEPLGDKKS